MKTDGPRLEALFDAALELPAPAERAAFLERECAGDAPLRARLERLLSAHEGAEPFFADCRTALNLTVPGDLTGAATDPEPELGQRIGPYILRQKIGEGGCGVVYLAAQETPVRRSIALKIIKPGMDTKSVIARFEAERQALALMNHPNIARVLDAGTTTTGRPFFVMELVGGIRISDYCDQNRLDIRQRLELFIQVCHAIQHAHQKGIIHRDIKPSNILVAMHDGGPVPKVIDFGIAKAMMEPLTDKTLHTIQSFFMGTPAYMSPEQADINGLDIDTRSDIYSLGALLHELLTGRTPFDQKELLAAGVDEMRRILREREPPRPSARLGTLSPEESAETALRRQTDPRKLRLLLKGDLDWIVMKALEKDRARRYETVNGLVMDIRRHLGNEPVSARPPSGTYRFQKWARRNRGVFAAVVAVMLALTMGLGTSTWLFLRESHMRRRAVAAEQQAERARTVEAKLRRQAEAREQVTQAAHLISLGKFDEAEQVAATTGIQLPTLEATAVLRSLGEWHARNRRWALAGERFFQVCQANQPAPWKTTSLDFIATGMALAAAGDRQQFARFRHHLASRGATEENPLVLERMLRAALLLPADAADLELLQPMARVFASAPSASIGNPSPGDHAAGNDTENFFKKLRLQNVGTRQESSLRFEKGVTTLVAGGANIWDRQDGFAYACLPIAGDFDFRMRILLMWPHWDNYTRVGLMARESPERDGSRHVMVAWNAENTFQVVMRAEEGGEATSVPQNPLPSAHGPGSWVRLQRVGAIFHAYTSDNGLDWKQLYQTTGGDKPFADPIYFGLAASSHDPDSLATSTVGDFGPTPTLSPDGALTLALLEYRRGNLAQATKWCSRVLAYPECSVVQNTMGRVILALAGQGSSQPEELSQQLAEARRLIERKTAGRFEAGDPGDDAWRDWAVAQVLLDEATNTQP